MARGRNNFRQKDVTRAVRAAQAAGIDIHSVEVDPATGKILIMTKVASRNDQLTDMDKWAAKYARSA